MMIRGTAVGLFIGGVMLWVMTKMIPFLALIMIDWVAIFMMVGAMFILIFIFGISNTGLLYDSIPGGTAVVPFIRRDGNIVPILFKRIFSGESFLENPKVGLIEDIGKGTVFLWGKKKIRFGLENLNYTSDPRHWGLTRELYSLGIDDTDDLYYLKNIPNIDNNKYPGLKEYYLIRMAEVYWNMTHRPERGAKKLVNEMMKEQTKKTVFGKKREHKLISFKQQEKK